MEPLTFGGGDVSQQRLPDQLVSEDQIPITLDRGNEPCLFGFLEGVDEGIRVHAGHLPDEIRGEHPAGPPPGNQRVAGLAGQPFEPPPNDEPDAFRHRCLVDLEVWSYPPALIRQHTGLGEVQVQLFDEERIALRLAIDSADQLLWRRLADQGLDHVPDVPERQSAQADPVDQLPTTELAYDA